MRKQVQKERCTKIMLTKCKAVCCLYNLSLIHISEPTRP